MSELVVIVPSRGRPESVGRLVGAWHATDAYADGAELMLAIDNDDPTRDRYLDAACSGNVSVRVSPRWQPMVHKLNTAAAARAGHPGGGPFAVGFAGDDHVPLTPGWARRYLDELHKLGTGVVYGNDLIQGANLPTQWAMTSDIVRALGRMVPADVEHLYCDNAIADLARAAGCLRYLDDVIVQHRHPVAGTAPWDAQYQRVNSADQYAADRVAYERWRERMATDVATVTALRAEMTADA